MEDVYKVVLHTPIWTKAFDIQSALSNRAISTVCILADNDYRLTLVAIQDKEEFRVGVSICNTKTDQFNKKEGIKRATMRALTSPVLKSKCILTKYETLEVLKEMHMIVGNNLKVYKKLVNGN